MDLQRHYISVRNRLRRPPNAVEDTGIALRKNKPPATKGYREERAKALDLAGKAKPFHEIRVFISEQCRAPKVIDFSMILRAVSHHYRVGVADLKGPARHAEIVEARHVAIIIALRLTVRSSVAL